MIYYRSRGAQIAEAWFGEEPLRDAGADIVSHRQSGTPVSGAYQRPFSSLVSDLTEDSDAIISRFGKNCRLKINRGDRRDGLVLEFLTEPAGLLDEFADFYDDFATQKALRRVDRRWLTGACQAGQLVLASALQDGARLVAHGYVVAGGYGWLQYSASGFRDGDSEYRALVGRANRWLHWQCMLRFKAMGVMHYDWGGIFEDESTAERAGINRFKQEFHGVEVRRFDCMRPVTVRGRLRIYLKRLANLGRSARKLETLLPGR